MLLRRDASLSVLGVMLSLLLILAAACAAEDNTDRSGSDSENETDRTVFSRPSTDSVEATEEARRQDSERRSPLRGTFHAHD